MTAPALIRTARRFRACCRQGWAICAVVASGVTPLSASGCGATPPTSSTDPGPPASGSVQAETNVNGASRGVTDDNQQPEIPPDDRVVQVILSMAEHPERAERWRRGTRVVDLGAPEGEQVTLGGWTTGLRAAQLDGGTGVALAPGNRASLSVPVDHGGPVRITLRARGFRGAEVLAAWDGDSVPVRVLGDASPEPVGGLPLNGGFARLVVDVPQATAGEHSLTLRVRGGNGSHAGQSASLALDWMRSGDPADAFSDERSAPSSMTTRSGEQPVLRLHRDDRVGFTLRAPVGGRLRGVLRAGPPVVVSLTRDGHATAPLAALSPGPFDVDLGAFAGDLVRVELTASATEGTQDTVRELVRPSVVVLTAPPPNTSPVRRPRNVLLYLVDTLRADHLSPYNQGTRVRTPGLARFVTEAVTMRRAHSQENWTKPSVATLLSSLMPWEHTAVQDASEVPESVALLPELLREHGFFTGSFIANGYVSDRFGFGQGWHTYRNYIREGRRSDAEYVAADVLSWLDEREDARPFFLYVHTIDPHVPYRRRDDTLSLYGDLRYAGPAAVANNADLLGRVKLGRVTLAAVDRAHLEALYDGEITYHDIHFQSIMDGLERRQLADDTLVIITSDHGEEFWDHGSVGHGHSVYEELLHVPMFVRHPGLPAHRTAVREVGDDVGLVDVLPTIFDALGLPAPEGISGRSFLPALLGESSSAPVGTVSGFMENWRTITLADLKLIHRANGTFKLYDLAADPSEQHDLAAQRPLAVRHLRALLGLRLAAADPVTRGDRRGAGPRRHQPASTRIDPETAAQLRALGYLID